MKNHFCIKLAVIFLLAAFSLIGCNPPTGGGGLHPGSSIIDYKAHDLSDPSNDPRENGQDNQENNNDGQNQTPPPKNNTDGESTGNEETTTTFATTLITNTTWYFEKADCTDNSCERDHYTETQNPDGQSSGQGGSYTEPTIVSTNIEDKSKEYDTPKSKLYLHVDNNNNAFFGAVSWNERGTEYWKEKTITYSNGKTSKEQVEDSYKKVISSSGEKTFTPYARGTVKQNPTDSKKILFDFPYANMIIENPSDPSDKSNMYLSVNSLGSYLGTAKLVKNSKGEGYDDVTPSINNNKLKLVYLVQTYTCKQKAPDGINICGNTYSDDYYTIWEKADFSEAMLTADIVKNDESLKNKVFMEKNVTFTAGNSYDYYCFYKDGFIKVKDFYEYWGNDIFVESKNSSSENKKTYIVSLKNGKYYLDIKDDSYLYYFTDAAENAKQDFSEYYAQTSTFEKTYYKSISAIPYTDRLVKNNELKGNKYKYKKDFVAGKIWYEQAASWSDTNGNKLECTNISSNNEIQTYALTLDGTAAEIKDIAKESDDKYIILLEAKSVVLEDKKDGTIIIKDGTNQYTLNYESRYGYKDDDFVEIDLTFENADTKLTDFDFEGSKYKLPKTTSIEELRKMYEAIPEVKKQKVGFGYVAFDKKDGTIIADSVKVQELDPKTLYIGYNKMASSFDITLAYKGSNFRFHRHNLYDYYNVEVIENLGDTVTVSGKDLSSARKPVYTQTVKITVVPETTGQNLKELFEQHSQEYDKVLQFTYGSEVLTPEKTLGIAGIKQGDTITVSETTQSFDNPYYY